MYFTIDAIEQIILALLISFVIVNIKRVSSLVVGFFEIQNMGFIVLLLWQSLDDVFQVFIQV